VNYTQLVQLHSQYSPDLSILAFPCNQFGNQEPGTPQEIKEFVKQYNVQFDVFAKVSFLDKCWVFNDKKDAVFLTIR
jgi:glutathione peroxidase-family protein